MREITLKSFAKINIGLNIVSKRDDGYHNLETIFYPLQLHDKITFRKADELSFHSNSEFLNSEKENLILKAIKSLEEYSGKKILVDVKLEKKIPIGAGLGGGSSNAAFTLIGINELFELKISKEELSEIALRLGSDVPLFLFDLPAYAESRGEKLTKINLKINDKILVVNPGIHISTKWAFSKIQPKKSEYNLKEIIKRHPNDYEMWGKFIRNDFEEIVTSFYPELAELKKLLIESGADFSIMTGSGSTFFAIYKNDSSIKQIEDKLKNKGYFTYVESPN